MSAKLLRRVLSPSLFALAAGVCLLGACDSGDAAYEYLPTPVEGWEQSDTLRFHADTVRSGGEYELTLGVRSSQAVPYPFQTLWLVVRQQWHSPERLRTDTVECRLATAGGDDTGHGVSLSQHVFPIATLQVPEGASADITVTHFMRRELLPGIADVGVRLRKIK